MQELTEPQAQKVMAKYLPIVQKLFPNEESDVAYYRNSKMNGFKVYVRTPHSNEYPDLDIFCLRLAIPYIIDDCL